MDSVDSVKIDRKALSVGSVLGPSDEKAYWLSKTPQERLQAAELMRQIVYGYDPSATRIQKVIEVVQLQPGRPRPSQG
jgi:hypothetical protein